jgi:hypothetical protein
MLTRHGIESTSRAPTTRINRTRTVMNYTLLIYETRADFARRTDPAEQHAYTAAWPPYTQALRDAGVFVVGAGLLQPETGTTVRLRDGKRVVQDGPYADTKEQLGGFVIIDVPNLDAALDWASRCPAAPTGLVEVRPNIPPLCG